MTSILIVDDSPTARRLLEEVFESDPETVVVGSAGDGAEAVRLAKRLRPDVITMDIHMPLLNGFEATRQIMDECPTPIVIVSASTLVHDVDWAMKALQAGALTLLLKPPGPAAPEYAAAVKELTEVVKAMAEVKVVRRRRRAAPAEPAREPQLEWARARIVAIAASTGGPPAIQQVLATLPPDHPAPVLVVQHIQVGFTDGLVSWLDSSIALRVKAAEDREPLQGGVAYVAPEEVHLGVTADGRVSLSRRPPIVGFRPSATHLFETVARAYQRGAVAVILTGMGEDGVEGLKTLRQSGGRVIAQDKETSVVYGMPAAAERAGVASVVLPLERIGPAILQATRSVLSD